MRDTKARSNRRLGAGMTEYIILVGLIAILLVGAVKRYGVQIDTTIEGTDKAIQNDVNNKISPLPTPPPSPSQGAPALPITSSDGKTGVDANQRPVTMGQDGHWHFSP